MLNAGCERGAAERGTGRCPQAGRAECFLTVRPFFLVLGRLYRGFAKFNDNLPTPPQSRCLANRIGAPVWTLVPFINGSKFLCQPSNFLVVNAVAMGI